MSAEAFRQSKEDLFSVQNSRKARIGGLEGLRDEAFMKRKAQAEKPSFGAKVAAEPRTKHADDRAAAWDKIAQAQKVAAGITQAVLYYPRDAVTPLTPSSSRSPARSCAWPRKRPSRTPTGSRNIASPASSRSS